VDLQGQRIIVIGGTSGIGLSVAQAAGHEGAEVVVAARGQHSIDSALALLPRGAEGHRLDATDEVAVDAFFRRIGEFDHLVYTAGESLLMENFAEADLGRARRFLDTRLWGAYTAVQKAWPFIRQGGSVVLTTGTAGQRPIAGTTVVASVCGAVESLTRALALELAPLRVSVVSPGIARTDLWRDLPEETRTGLYESTAGTHPVGRVGEAADIAEAYLYLMRGGYSTGSVVTVDGGGLLV
jgi:NAD(P)-dependent dehydrogenase (short-subunit alcohol dehydrogenase family)